MSEKESSDEKFDSDDAMNADEQEKLLKEYLKEERAAKDDKGT